MNAKVCFLLRIFSFFTLCCLWLCPVAAARTLSFQALSQIVLPAGADAHAQELATTAARLEAESRLIAEAQAGLMQEAFFRNHTLEPALQPALVLALAQTGDLLEYAPGPAQYRMRLRLESRRLPAKIMSYYHSHFNLIWLLEGDLQRGQALRPQILAYFQRLGQSHEPGYRALLQQTEGARLFDAVQLELTLRAVRYAFVRQLPEEALALIDEAPKSLQEMPDLLLWRAVIQEQQQNFDAALSDLNRVIGLLPGKAFPVYLRGRVYRRQALQPARCRQDLNRSLELNPHLSQAYWERGKFLLTQLDCPAALVDFKRACELGMSSACHERCNGF